MQLGIHDIPLFIVSGLLLNIAPGPDSILIMTRSATQGWRAGSAAALGIGAGTCVHVLAAALGLSALLAASSWAFTLLKWVGAAYLVWIGLQMLLARRRRDGEAASTSGEAAASVALPLRKVFVQGFLSNVLNPKVALFFLAFVPQFIAPDAPHKALAFIVLGAIFNFNGMLWCHFLALSTAFASARLRVGGALAQWLNRAIGALFLSFGLKLALSER
ncbi:LysE family translocator [Kinneretia asaccharophila]|uniref:RhtB (Resistance to homoserine/threonine) family protein n=1 Tax=Roseateles asaccharophilus TaxID=582607 RepID=A0A4R6NAZ9_9BURK|nr:LysE family translocator [Roseateles asaccharophilus]MDN3543159.1 LysE family translocator [Roseateles asaccharophilus]TDP13142.1 RhtB (resistance to homoserine/threonine) family protein [Roseateles asaccharophilus]